MATGVNTEGFWRSLRIAVTAMTVVFLVAPMLIVLIISFSSAPFLMFPPPGLSLQWYRKLFGDPAWSDSLITSLEIVIPTGLLAMTVGTAAALGLARTEFPANRLVVGFLMAPLVVPVIIIAAAIFGVFRIWDLNGTLLGFILAHTVLTVPYAVPTPPEYDPSTFWLSNCR